MPSLINLKLPKIVFAQWNASISVSNVLSFNELVYSKPSSLLDDLGGKRQRDISDDGNGGALTCHFQFVIFPHRVVVVVAVLTAKSSCLPYDTEQRTHSLYDIQVILS